MNPVEAVIPGAQGRILAVLARTTAEVNLRTLADLASVSPAQATRVLPKLVELGLVERREVPPSALFRLAREHLAARAVIELAGSWDRAMEELTTLAEELLPHAVNVTVFGSFARGEATSESDIDLLVVWAETSEDEGRWVDALAAFTDRIRQLTGDPVNVVEAGEWEMGRLLRSPRPLWKDIVRDGFTLAGVPLDALKGRESA